MNLLNTDFTVKKLEPAQEKELWHLYKNEGSVQARQDLIRSYLPLVFKLAKVFHLPSPLQLELVQEGTIGLIEAVENFDPAREVHFSIYARFRIRGRMLNFLAAAQSGASISLDQPIGAAEEQLTWAETVAADEPEPEEQVEEKLITERVLQTVERLPEKEQKIIQEVYLGQGEIKQVAEKLEISLPHFYRLQKKAIRRMRGMLSRFIAELKV
ncbi:MAG: sigma-70 family RNA polymerase sigma factor [bacterium]